MTRLLSTLEYLLSALAGVVARVESLPLAAKRLGDFVRGMMSEGERQVEGLFESLLAQSFDGRR
jgi:hypothetical protein